MSDHVGCLHGSGCIGCLIQRLKDALDEAEKALATATWHLEDKNVLDDIRAALTRIREAKEGR